MVRNNFYQLGWASWSTCTDFSTNPASVRDSFINGNESSGVRGIEILAFFNLDDLLSEILGIIMETQYIV